MSDEEKTSIHSIADLIGKSPQQNAYLVVITAKAAAAIGRMFKLERPETTIGRSSEAQFQVEDDGISRRHAKIALTANGKFQVMDLGSTNGTFVNGLRVEVRVLQDGDKIQIGTNTVLKFSLQDHLEEQYQRSIYDSATRDALTRIYNKKFFLDSLRKEFAYCLRHQVPLSLIMIDVDLFKNVNDTYGHQAGDFVLSRIAQRINESIRTEDIFARYGGEEFALLLRESTEEQTWICAERCRRAVDCEDFNFNGTPIRATISVGVANLLESDFSHPDQLLATADRYLYLAKQRGRNRVESKVNPLATPF